MEYEAGEDAWIKLDPVSVRSGEGAYRVLAGWRPNDVTANGRRQSATLVISNRADGSQREEYTVSRRNYGLPVTWMHGIWWCKYNARGDSRSFEDQVLSSDDPARAQARPFSSTWERARPKRFLICGNGHIKVTAAQGCR